MLQLSNKKQKKRKKRRNPNGFGSVYEQKDGRRRKPWVARITTGWTEDGKQIRQVVGYFETSEEALKALVLYRENPTQLKPSITLGELYDKWSKSKFTKISNSTIDNYKAAVLVCNRAAKNDIPKKYPKFLQNAIRRVI